jgi:hypothetical protein
VRCAQTVEVPVRRYHIQFFVSSLHFPLHLNVCAPTPATFSLHAVSEACFHPKTHFSVSFPGTTLYFTPHRQTVGKQRLYVRLFPLVDYIVLYYTGVEKVMLPSAQYRHVLFIRCKLGDPCSSQTIYPQGKV